MKSILIAIVLIAMQTSSHDQVAKINQGGTWTFRNNQYKANKFIHHYYSFTAFDTTQHPEPKFIIDFFEKPPVENGTYKMVAGMPMAPDQVDIGVGYQHDGVLTFYSSTGGNGKETVTVKVKNGIVTVSGTAIELANQKNANDKSKLTFNITML